MTTKIDYSKPVTQIRYDKSKLTRNEAVKLIGMWEKEAARLAGICNVKTEETIKNLKENESIYINLIHHLKSEKYYLEEGNKKLLKKLEQEKENCLQLTRTIAKQAMRIEGELE